MTEAVAMIDEFDAVLTIAIDTQRLIDLDDFAQSLAAWRSDYARFFKGRFPNYKERESGLLVKDVRSGSIFIDLVPALAPFVAELEQIKTIVSYVDKVRTTVLPWFKEGGRNPNATIGDLNGFHKALDGIAKDSNGSLALRARYVQKNGKGEEVRSEFLINSDQARIVQGNIEAERQEIQAPGEKEFSQVIMYLHQASLEEIKTGKPAGEKGIIETISDKPLKIVYASELAGRRIKSELREDDNPLKKAFLVDVNVETVRGAPHAYRILHVHSVENLP